MKRKILIFGIAIAALGLFSARQHTASSEETMAKDKESYSDEEARKKLSPIQFEVTRHNGTEPPFDNTYWNNHEDGIYVDVVSGEPLFSSKDKFDSGTGWPSFTKPLEQDDVVLKTDSSLWMTRTEVRSKRANSHLGHLFDDGPAPTGQRYCINSAALRFIPVSRLAAEGYGKYLALFAQAGKAASASPAAKPSPVAESKPNTEIVDLAGGCFWGMQQILRKIPGVISTEVGYTGGGVRNATYENHEGHAEAVRVVFDPEKLPFEQLLHWFFRMHDPTTLDRQGNDVGTSYRSAVFYHTEEQRKIAEAFKDRLNKRGKWGAPVVTEIIKAGDFWKAEEYHQDYLVKHPHGYTCHFLRPESVLGN